MKYVAQRTVLVPLAVIALVVIFYVYQNRDGWLSENLNVIQTEKYEEFIRERLTEAELIWRRGIREREAAEAVSPISPDHPWVHVNYRTIWDFFYPNFNCPHSVERLGRVGDGGKWVCGISHLAKSNLPCVVYSYGINTDTSFEKDILNRTRCKVFAFDYTVDESKVDLAKLYPDRSEFYKIGLGNRNKDSLRTLKTEMDQHGHSFIDILKIDIEGGEYLSIPKILQDFPQQLPIGQLLIEIHLDTFPQKNLYKNFKAFWTPLENAGMRAFRTEPNLYNILLGASYPTYYEFSLLNIRTDHVILHG